MSRVFISYRREDSRWIARALKDRLCEELGSEQVFMDVDSIDPGLDFVEAIQRAVAQVDVVIAVLGKQWLNVQDKQGNRRLDNPNDFVRIELATALKRGIRLIPLLERGAAMPTVDELPDDLKPLCRRNAIEISDVGFANDVGRLIESLRRVWKHEEEEVSIEIPTLDEAGPPVPPASATAVTGPPEVSGNGSHSSVDDHVVVPPPVAASSKPSGRRWGVPLTVVALLALLVGGIFFSQPQWEPLLAQFQSGSSPGGDDPADSVNDDVGDEPQSAVEPGIEEELDDGLPAEGEPQHLETDEVSEPDVLGKAAPADGQSETMADESETATESVDSDVEVESGLSGSDVHATAEQVVESSDVDTQSVDVSTERDVDALASDGQSTSEPAMDDVQSVADPAGAHAGDAVEATLADVTPVVGPMHGRGQQALPQGEVSGVVFLDMDGDSQLDEEDTPLVGVEVTVGAAGGQPEQAVSDENGRYSVSVPVGPTVLAVNTASPQVPLGAQLTTVIPGSLDISAEEPFSIDLGFRPLCTVCGIVFDDVNGNKIRDHGEKGITNVCLEFTSGAEKPLAFLSGPEGQYEASVPPGEFAIRVEAAGSNLPESVVATTENPRTVSVSVEGLDSLDFGFQRQSTLNVLVFNDLNGNRKRDAGEPGIPNVRLAVAKTRADAEIQTADVDGNYCESMPPGNRIVQVDVNDSNLPVGSTLTTENPVRVELTPDGTTDVAFAFRQQGTISVAAFNDINGNSVRDASEPGVPGARIIITDADQVKHTEKTGDDGRCVLSVHPGDFVIDVAAPAAEKAAVVTTKTAKSLHVPAGETAEFVIGIRKPPLQRSTKDLKAEDYEKLFSEAKSAGVAVEVTLHLDQVDLRAGEKKTPLKKGDRLQVSRIIEQNSQKWLSVVSVTKEDGTRDDVTGWIWMDSLIQSVAMIAEHGDDTHSVDQNGWTREQDHSGGNDGGVRGVINRLPGLPGGRL